MCLLLSLTMGEHFPAGFSLPDVNLVMRNMMILSVLFYSVLLPKNALDKTHFK